MNQTPVQISKKALQVLVMKAYNLSREAPKEYPTVDEIDSLLESEEFQEEQIKEDAFKLFVLCIISGYPRDYVWHRLHPGHQRANAANLIYYLFTPVTGKASLQNHSNVWDEDADEEEQTDRQSAFEYIQSIVMDENLYQIQEEPKTGSGKTGNADSATIPA